MQSPVGCSLTGLPIFVYSRHYLLTYESKIWWMDKYVNYCGFVWNSTITFGFYTARRIFFFNVDIRYFNPTRCIGNVQQDNTYRVGELSLRLLCLLMNGWSPIRRSAGRTGQTSLTWGGGSDKKRWLSGIRLGWSSKTLFAYFVTTSIVYSMHIDLHHVIFYVRVINQPEMSVVFNYDCYHLRKTSTVATEH